MKRCLSLLLAIALVAGQAPGQDAAAPAQTSVDALLARLATIELQATVDRDFEAAGHELDAALAAAGASLSADPRVAAAAARIRRAVSEAQSQDRTAVEDAVWKAAADGDTAALSAMGGVAVDLLLDGARAGKARPVTTAHNNTLVSADSMLWMALALDAGRTAAVVRDERRDLEARGLDIRHLLEQALSPDRWKFTPGGSPLPLDPALLDAVTAELEEAQTADDIRFLYNDGDHSVLGALAKFGALTDRMCAALARIVRDSPSNQAARIMQPLSGERVGSSFWPATARPLFEALLDDPRADIRRAAAAMLARGPQSGALLARVDDPDSQVRMAVARSLRAHSFSSLVWTSRDSDQTQPAPRYQRSATDAQSHQALLRLAADSDPAVREATAQAVLENPVQVPAETLEKLAADPDAGVREAMTWLKHPDEALERRLLVGLARDTQPLVLGALDERLDSWDFDIDDDVTTFLAVFRERQVHPTVPFGTTQQGGEYRAHSLFEVVADKPAGRRALTRWSLDTGELEPLRYAVGAILDGEDGSFAIDDLDVWMSLEPADYARLLPMLHELAPLVASRLLEELDPTLRRVDIADALQPLVRDESVPAPLRLQMAAFVTRSGATEARIADVEWLLLSEPVRRWQPEKTWQNSYLTAAALAVPQPARNALLAHVLAAGTLTDGQLGPLLEAYSAADEGGSVLTREILQRWLASTPPGTTAVVVQAVAALGSMDTPESLEWLITAAHDHATERTAIEALVRRPEPEALGVLGQCIGSPWITDDDAREQVSYEAIGALTGMLSEDAVEELLKGASRAPNSLARDLCLQGVQKIRSYLDSLADWQRRKSTSATRDEAVARLVQLLADPDANVRAESVRGLGTLRAVEQLPDVIEALRDSSNVVREAARAALDVLNAAVAAPPDTGAAH